MTALACPARAERGDRFVDTPLASLGRLDTLNREHMPLSLAVRQPVEELAGLCIPGESRRKVLRHDYCTRLCIEFDGDFQLVAGRDTCALAMLRADWEHEPPTHERNGAAIGMASHRDAHGWSLTGPQ